MIKISVMWYISFHTYVAYSIVLILFYYCLFIGIVYKKSFIPIINGNWRTAISSEQQDDQIAQIAASLHVIISKAAAQQTGKSEILAIIRQRLLQYDSILLPAHRRKLQTMIEHDFVRLLNINLNESEINTIWPALSS